MNACDALLVLQRSDVAHIVAHRERFDGIRLLFIDAASLDEALGAGLANVELRRLDVAPDLQARAASEALARATLVDARLGRLRAQLFDGTVFDGWDVGLFFMQLLRLLVAREVGAACERFPEARLGLLRPNVAQQMYFDAAAVVDLVARDPARWCVLGDYAEARMHQPQAYAFGFDTPAIAAAMAQQPAGAITHLPTCFYDRARIEAELQRVHPHTLDLPGVFWDVPIRRGASRLRPLHELPAPEPACPVYAERARALLEGLLGDLLPQPAGRAQQLDSWADRCRLQAVNYTGLAAALAGHAPAFVLTDHDTGSNGVLFSVADRLGSPISVLPHSAHPAMVLPHARRVTAIERAGIGTPVRTVLGQRVAVRPVRLHPIDPLPAGRAAPAGVRTVCLLLNTVETHGLSYIDVLQLGAFYRPLAALCERADVELAVRLKPGSPALGVMSGALGIAVQRLIDVLQEPLPALAARSQLCIAYGEPSTGALAFLEAGACVINACEAAWPVDALCCLPLVADGVVPALRLNDALQEVQRLIVDTDHFRARRAEQAGAIERRAAGAHEHFLEPSPGA